MTAVSAPRVDVTQLTPLLFLERSAEVFPDKVAISYGDRAIRYGEMADMTQRVAAALRGLGIEAGDRVAYLMPNLPEMLIGHFAVPLLRAQLVAINTRLSGPEISYILQHSGAKVLVADTELLAPLVPHLVDCPELEAVVQVVDVAPEVEVGVRSLGHDELVEPVEGQTLRRELRLERHAHRVPLGQEVQRGERIGSP